MSACGKVFPGLRVVLAGHGRFRRDSALTGRTVFQLYLLPAAEEGQAAGPEGRGLFPRAEAPGSLRNCLLAKLQSSLRNFLLSKPHSASGICDLRLPYLGGLPLLG
jgi:hypothetical protein